MQSKLASPLYEDPLIINFFKYPLMSVKIISAIHFEALLLWKKGAIYRKRDKKIKNNLSYENN